MTSNGPDRATPDPFADMRITTLSALRGANFWSRRPVIRMDVNIGAFDDISSADHPWCIDQLITALPGLESHRCSVGAPGGFIQRLREGTYAGHITEHVAIELQAMIGHDVGYGRTRGTGTVGEYTVVFEYLHQAVGLRTAALALETTQRAFAGTLDTVQHAIAELTSLATTEDVPPLRQNILCGITGSAYRDEMRDALMQHGFGGYETDDALVISLAPMYIFQAGLPYSHSEIAVILDTDLHDVPERYRDQERAAQLLSVVADAVPSHGAVVCPADAHYVHDFVRDAGRQVLKFSPSSDPAQHIERAVTRAAEHLNHSYVSNAERNRVRSA